MKALRVPLLLCSVLVVGFLLCGNLVAQTSDDNAWRQVVLFSEILALVSDNYVDPVATDELLAGAFEGLLAGLDAQGAYLTPEEVQQWKRWSEGAPRSDPGLVVLKAGRGLQVVGLVPGSAAAASTIEVGDRLRSIDGQQVQDLSLLQAWRLLQGTVGSVVRLDVLHPRDSFRRELVELVRAVPEGPGFRLEVVREIGHLHLYDLERLDEDALGRQLAELKEAGIDALVVDVRNLADVDPRAASRVARSFVHATALVLRDRSGRLVESAGEKQTAGPIWEGSIAVLVNGATAGGAEALATLIRAERSAPILGEPTYGLGAEPTLYEMADGSGILVSSKLWETSAGARWNGEGLKPDEVISGKGEDFAEVSADQLERALGFLEQKWKTPQENPERREAA